MLRERAKLFTAVQFASDALLSAAAFPLAYHTRLRLERFAPEKFDRLLNPALYPLSHYAPVVLLALAVWAAAALPMGALAWIVAPAIDDHFSGEGNVPLVKALLLLLTAGLINGHHHSHEGF